MPTLANPLGLIALLGIPAVLVIHFLQRKAKEIPVSTLFLLEHTRREAASGRRFERLIPSIPLWMQLLAVLLLTWILAEPRYQKSGSIQRIAVVMDSSASMSVFKEEAIRALETALPGLRGGASDMQLTVLESLPNAPRIHTGASIEEMKQAIKNWQPSAGPVDPTQALRLARSLVSRDGSVVYLTDTPPGELPFHAVPLTVGRPIDNVGFTGVSFTRDNDTLIWRAMVRNHGTKPADRTWALHASTGSTPARPLHLEAGAMATLQAAFPMDAENVRIALSPDAFVLDDVLPLVAPRPKILKLANATSAAFAGLSGRLVKSLDATEAAGDANEADLTLASYNPLDPVPPQGNTFIFVEDETRTGNWLKGGIIAENHPWMDGLNWQSLLVRETIQLERRPEDRVLLWQDTRPLILLREQGETRSLLINFDPSLSNAEKQPAFAVLFHRFAESIRRGKVAAVAGNFETGQVIELAVRKGKPVRVSATDPEGKALQAPAGGTGLNAIRTPGFLTATQEDTPILKAAVHFGDPREADLSQCGSQSGAAPAGQARIERHTRPDPLWRTWILLLGGALLVSWKFSAGRQTPAQAAN